MTPDTWEVVEAQVLGLDAPILLRGDALYSPVTGIIVGSPHVAKHEGGVLTVLLNFIEMRYSTAVGLRVLVCNEKLFKAIAKVRNELYPDLEDCVLELSVQCDDVPCAVPYYRVSKEERAPAGLVDMFKNRLIDLPRVGERLISLGR